MFITKKCHLRRRAESLLPNAVLPYENNKFSSLKGYISCKVQANSILAFVYVQNYFLFLKKYVYHNKIRFFYLYFIKYYNVLLKQNLGCDSVE